MRGPFGVHIFSLRYSNFQKFPNFAAALYDGFGLISPQTPMWKKALESIKKRWLEDAARRWKMRILSHIVPRLHDNLLRLPLEAFRMNGSRETLQWGVFNS